MVMSEWQPATEFVLRHGTEIERARMEHIVNGAPVPDAVREQLEQAQRGDGGWSAFWATDYSSLDATCYQLAQADQLGIDRRSTTVVDAIRFLAERQHADGSWEEDPVEAGDAPVWARPGDMAAQLYVTANCGFWVAMSGLVPSAAREAATFLRSYLVIDEGLPSFPHAHWLAAALWQRLDMATEAATCLAYLRDRVPALSAGNLAWMLIALQQGGVPSEDLTIRQGFERLMAMREPAGHWPSDEGADNAAHVTVEALYASKLYYGLS